MSDITIICLLIAPFVFVALLISACYFHKASKWYKKGFEDTLWEIDRYLSGERSDRPHVEVPHGPYMCMENEWWWKGAYAAYDANFVNLYCK